MPGLHLTNFSCGEPEVTVVVVICAAGEPSNAPTVARSGAWMLYLDPQKVSQNRPLDFKRLSAKLYFMLYKMEGFRSSNFEGSRLDEVSNHADTNRSYRVIGFSGLGERTVVRACLFGLARAFSSFGGELAFELWKTRGWGRYRFAPCVGAASGASLRPETQQATCG